MYKRLRGNVTCMTDWEAMFLVCHRVRTRRANPSRSFNVPTKPGGNSPSKGATKPGLAIRNDVPLCREHIKSQVYPAPALVIIYNPKMDTTYHPSSLRTTMKYIRPEL